MEINFEKEYLRELYETGKTMDRKHRFQPDIVSRYQLRIKVLEQAQDVEELYGINSLLINDKGMGKYTCQRPVHPGELLKEEIESRNLPQTRLAEQTGISYKILNDILNCRRPLTTTTAMLFEAALGISAGLLMRMQLDYNMQKAAGDKTFMARLKKIREYAAIL